MRHLSTLTYFGLLLIATCGMFGFNVARSQPPTQAPVRFDRSKMLAHLAYNVMLPTYLSFEADAVALQKAVEQLCDAPTIDRLETAQDRWRQAASRWNRSEAFQLHLTQTYAKSIGFWPTRVPRLQQALKSEQPITPQFVETMGAAAHGLSAIEYFLFDATAGPLAVLTAMQEGPLAQRWCPYLLATATHLTSTAQAVTQLWRPEGSNLSGRLARAGEGDLAYPTTHRAISDIVNQLVSAVESVQHNKMGKPLRGNGQKPWPNAVEAGRSGFSVALIAATLEGARAIYSGDGTSQSGPGLQAFLTALGSDLGPRITQQFNAALTAVHAIPDPLRVALVEQPETVQAAYQTVRQLLILLKVDMTNVLSVTVDFSDNDGD